MRARRSVNEVSGEEFYSKDNSLKCKFSSLNFVKEFQCFLGSKSAPNR